ncbi:MAG TPA: twin-arginine translocase TatA/TatE family subunit [Gaiellaceae bacterium]
MPGFVGFPEILLLGLVALLVFGPKRLPEMGRGLGKGMREFKDSVTGTSASEIAPVTQAPVVVEEMKEAA